MTDEPAPICAECQEPIDLEDCAHRVAEVTEDGYMVFVAVCQECAES